jgi:hypothetical protein
LTHRPLTRIWTALAVCGGTWLSVTLPAPAEESSQFVWGQVLDAETGQPIDGATLHDPGSGASLQTDESGRFFFARTVPVVQVSRTDYQSQAFNLPRPSLVARRGGGGEGRTRLSQSGFTLRLRRLPPTTLSEPMVAVLPSHITLGWRPDFVTERFSDAAGADNRDGPRSATGWIDGAVNLGPVMLSGTFGSHWDEVRRTGTSASVGRWEHQGTFALNYVQRWNQHLAAAFGPAFVLQQISLLEPPGQQGRQQDDLDVASTRWGAGLQAMLSAWPWQAVPVALEIRLGLYPATWQLTDSVNRAPQGMWAMQGSAGLRWYPVPRFGLDLRYLYDHWQTIAYYQGSHGVSLGGSLVF